MLSRKLSHMRVDPAAMNMLDMAMQRKPGEDQPRDPETGRMLPKDNNVSFRAEHQPKGNTAAAGLRRLRNAASKGNAQATERHRRASRPDQAQPAQPDCSLANDGLTLRYSSWQKNIITHVAIFDFVSLQ